LLEEQDSLFEAIARSSEHRRALVRERERLDMVAAVILDVRQHAERTRGDDGVLRRLEGRVSEARIARRQVLPALRGVKPRLRPVEVCEGERILDLPRVVD